MDLAGGLVSFVSIRRRLLYHAECRMMVGWGENESRKEAIRKYKERRTPRGIFAVRCAPTGGVWVGASRNLEAEKNHEWFALRAGLNLQKELQAEWKARGEEAFSYEVLETFDDDIHPTALADLLKSKRREWAEKLGAQTII